jgi:hypothetical protein
VQGHYRVWAAEQGTRILAGDPKLAEWKVRMRMQDHPMFGSYKEAQAQARRNVLLIQGVIEGLRAQMPSD